jgi:hypothetical protein
MKRMMKSKILASFLCAAAPLLTGAGGDARDAGVAGLAREAYIYATPAVMFALNKSVFSNVPAPSGKRAPVNQLAHFDSMPDHTYTDVVTINLDTLYSAGYVDLARQPVVLSVPDTGGRYYVVQIMDAWGNVPASLGTRTTGGRAGNYMLARNDWNGPVPEGVQRVGLETAEAFIVTRIFIKDRGELDAVRKIQGGLKLVPLDAWGAGYSAPVNSDTRALSGSPLDMYLSMDVEKFFQAFNDSLAKNPAYGGTEKDLEKFARLNLGAGRKFSLSAFDEKTRRAVLRGAGEAREFLADPLNIEFRDVNKWRMTRHAGEFGRHYANRAFVSLYGYGANMGKDAMYFNRYLDGGGGKNKYKIHFAPGQLPKVNAFWSLSIYDAETHALVENPIGRHKLGGVDRMKYNPDGGLDIYIQMKNPGGGAESNWLPAPPGKFKLVLRCYWPKEEMFMETLTLPDVKKSG